MLTIFIRFLKHITYEAFDFFAVQYVSGCLILAKLGSYLKKENQKTVAYFW